MFSLVKDGRIKVSYDSESFIGFYDLAGLEKPKEDTTQRTRGTITVRNNGVGIGKLFIYRENRVLTPNHTTVGKIVKGMEIIDIAKENDFITVKAEQQRLMLLNKTQKEATEILSAAGVEHMIDRCFNSNLEIADYLGLALYIAGCTFCYLTKENNKTKYGIVYTCSRRGNLI